MASPFVLLLSKRITFWPFICATAISRLESCTSCCPCRIVPWTPWPPWLHPLPPSHPWPGRTDPWSCRDTHRGCKAWTKTYQISDWFKWDNCVMYFVKQFGNIEAHHFLNWPLAFAWGEGCPRGSPQWSSSSMLSRAFSMVWQNYFWMVDAAFNKWLNLLCLW